MCPARLWGALRHPRCAGGRPAGRTPFTAGCGSGSGAPPGCTPRASCGEDSHISTWIRGAALLPPGHLSPAGMSAVTHPPCASTDHRAEAHRGLQDNGGKWPVSSWELLVEETQDRTDGHGSAQGKTGSSGERGRVRVLVPTRTCPCMCVGGHSGRSISWR